MGLENTMALSPLQTRHPQSSEQELHFMWPVQSNNAHIHIPRMLEFAHRHTIMNKLVTVDAPFCVLTAKHASINECRRFRVG